MMMMGQQQQHQPQPTTTTSTADQEEEEEDEEFSRLWIGGDMQHWMDEVEVEEEKKDRTLWIGDLQHWMDEAYIHQCFVHSGEDFTSKVIRNNKKTTTECYGFIEFKSHAIAARFLNKFNGTPMPRVAGSSFSLNWASSSFSGGEQQRLEEEEEEEEEEEDETFKHLDCITKSYTGVYSHSCWEDMLMWWSIARGTRTLEAVRAAHRVYMIGAIFKHHNDAPPDTVIEESLDELPRYVDVFDIAKELHSLDALDPILGELYNPNAGIRAKAAKLIITMAKKNHNCWQLVSKEIRAGLIYHTYFNECDPTVQSIALDAISSLFANDNPGISAFGREGYVDLIRHVFEHGYVDHQRKALNLIARLVEEHNSDYKIVTELEYPSILMRLATSVDAELRKAAFRCLIVLARVEKGENSGQVVKNDEKLKQILQKRIEAINAMAPEDLADE